MSSFESKYRVNPDGTVAGAWNPKQVSPNIGGTLPAPEYGIIHYTASTSAGSSINWLCNPQAQASAHFVISQEGEISQLVNLKRVAWHAGKSEWKGLVGLNSRSIGFELVNPGILTKRADGSYVTASGQAIDASTVILAKHKNGGPVSPWQAYPPAQIQAVLDLIKMLREAGYPLRTILGHDDIAPGRKTDPGPAFPMADFVSRLEDHAEDTVQDDLKTRTNSNLRGGPGTNFDVIWTAPAGTRFIVQRTQGEWSRVQQIGEPYREGWMHSDLLVL